jgi:hypothetical protein
MGLDPAQEAFTRVPFVFEKPAKSSEDFSYWGALGFLLIWPVVIWLLFERGNHGSGKIFAVAAVVFLIVQAFSGPYDPWRGRYFLSCAPFALIALGMWMNCHSSRFFRYY